MSSSGPAAPPYSSCVVASLCGRNKLCSVGVFYIYTTYTSGKVLAYFEALRVITFPKASYPSTGRKL